MREYLREFYSHSVKHPHGWGLMREENGRTEIIKEGVCAVKSEINSSVIEETEPQKNMLAHIRLATVGSVKNENCHPFSGEDISGRRWTLIHNGTIYSSKKLIPYMNTQIGDTDSERVFLYLLDEMNNAISQNGRELNARRRFEIIDSLVTDLSPRNKLNMIIFDGEILYVHKNMKNTLFYKQEDCGIVFSTQPLDNGAWQKFPIAQLFAYKDGEKLFSGTNHGNVFVPTLEYITAMDAMNI
ncbi:MAG: class II glutamine amidotransferase [Oscillospiraceae bacterium]